MGGQCAGRWTDRQLASDFHKHAAANLTRLNVYERRGLLCIQTGKQMLQNGYKFKWRLRSGI
jgi:hypothetical protein